MRQLRNVTRVYDPDQRATAARLEAQYRPRWAVWWGTGTRRFWAVPCWQGAPVLIVDGRNVDELLAAMRAAETGPARTPVGAWGRP
ncbi:hypothetical protein [Thermomonospora amylolytica]|uniref:hypothetical protein n=1 Tax=Thermomonospora amylolytica TaxID=1411117 RepID=UPI001300BA0F|nr:hypothetical protein [Thermomonospora amylolytica]